MKPILERAVVKIGWLETDSRSKAQHLISPQLIFEYTHTVGKELQSLRMFGIRKKHVSQSGVARTALGLRHHEDIAN